MKINIRDLKEGINNFVFTETAEEIGFSTDDIKFNGAVYSSIKINNLIEKFIIEGKVKISVVLECSRCLEPYDYIINSEFKVIHNKNVVLGKGELNSEHIDEVILTDDTLNIDEDVRQTIILELPMKPVCKESCKGLCDICGKNINLNKCDCKLNWNKPFSKYLSNLRKEG